MVHSFLDTGTMVHSWYISIDFNSFLIWYLNARLIRMRTTRITAYKNGIEQSAFWLDILRPAFPRFIYHSPTLTSPIVLAGSEEDRSEGLGEWERTGVDGRDEASAQVSSAPSTRRKK